LCFAIGVDDTPGDDDDDDDDDAAAAAASFFFPMENKNKKLNQNKRIENMFFTRRIMEIHFPFFSPTLLLKKIKHSWQLMLGKRVL
jgi:hypothetical protein